MWRAGAAAAAAPEHGLLTSARSLAAAANDTVHLPLLLLTIPPASFFHRRLPAICIRRPLLGAWPRGSSDRHRKWVAASLPLLAARSPCMHSGCTMAAFAQTHLTLQQCHTALRQLPCCLAAQCSLHAAAQVTLHAAQPAPAAEAPLPVAAAAAPAYVWTLLHPLPVQPPGMPRCCWPRCTNGTACATCATPTWLPPFLVGLDSGAAQI